MWIVSFTTSYLSSLRLFQTLWNVKMCFIIKVPTCIMTQTPGLFWELRFQVPPLSVKNHKALHLPVLYPELPMTTAVCWPDTAVTFTLTFNDSLQSDHILMAHGTFFLHEQSKAWINGGYFHQLLQWLIFRDRHKRRDFVYLLSLSTEYQPCPKH